MSNKNPIDNKLTQHALDPLQDSNSCQLTTMGANQCNAEGAHNWVDYCNAKRYFKLQ